MKKFLNPEIEVLELDVEDIVATSGLCEEDCEDDLGWN